jgi:hypothetical protein
MLYQCKDASLCFIFIFSRKLALLKLLWIKTVLDHPEYRNRTFSLGEFAFDDCYRLGQQIIKEYNSLHQLNYGNFETFNSTINQLEYYRDAGCLKMLMILNR